MFDQLDFICPVLYQHWDSDDATPAKLRTWLADSTRQALEKSHDLTRRNGFPIPLAPILSFWILKKRPPNDPVRRPSPLRAWLSSWRSFRTPPESRPSSSGQGGRRSRKWSPPRSR
jgi:hypothetical protein